MSYDERTDREDALAELLAEYDEQLAAETPHAKLDTQPRDGERAIDDELESQFQEAKECLDLLERVRRRMTPGIAAQLVSNSTNGNSATLSAPPPAASTLGRFQIERELGHGGLGVVYLAFDPKLGRRVALKVPRVESLVSEELRRRFLREAEAAARLAHPNLVSVYESGADGAICYIASEYCPGPTLAQWIKARQSPVPIEMAARLVAHLAAAVQHAHGRGVLHRDIKPSNVLLAGIAGNSSNEPIDGAGLCPKLTDFGMAKLLEREGDETRTGALIGTPAYMAPEQAEGRTRELDARTDVYALGAILYELLTGIAPAAGHSDVESLRRLLYEEAVAPRRIRPEIPRDLEAICLKCLARKPEGRYTTAQELADELGRFLDRRPTVARPLSAGGVAWKWARRRPAIAALAGVSSVAAVALIGVILAYNASLSAALAESRRLLYATDMKIAFDAWQNADVTVVREKLDRHVPKAGEEDLRTFIWHFLWRRANGDQKTLYQHDGPAFCVAYSPDGTILASGGADSEIRLWDVRRDRALPNLKGHTGEVNDLRFSPDGRLMATSSDDNTIRIWKVGSSESPRVLTGFTDQWVYGLSFSPDGELLAAGGEDGKVRFWNTSTWEPTPIMLKHDVSVGDVAFSPDGRFLLTGCSDGHGRLFEIESGHIKHDFYFGRINDRPNHVGAIAFSPDGRTVAIGCLQDETIHVCDAETGKELRALSPSDGWIHAVSFDPRGELLLGASRTGIIRIWNARSLEPVCTLLGNTQRVWDLAVSDGSRLATACGDGTTRQWDLAAALNTDQQVTSPHAMLNLEFLGPSDRWVACEYQGRTCAWDTRSGHVLGELDTREAGNGGIRGVSPDGSYFALCTQNKRAIEIVHARNLHSTLRIDAANDATFEAATFSPDGRLIATGESASRLDLWDAQSGERVASCDTRQGEVLEIAFVDRGQTIATSGHFGVRLWEATSLEPRGALPGFEEKAYALVAAPDESVLAAGSIHGDIYVWDLATKDLRAVLVGHRERITSLSFSSDSRTLASAGHEGTTRLWDVRTWQEVATLPGRVFGTGYLPAKKVAFSDDGRTLAIASGSQMVLGELRFLSAAHLEAGERDHLLLQSLSLPASP